MARLYKKKSDLQAKEKNFRRKTLMGAFLFAFSLLAVFGGLRCFKGNIRIVFEAIGIVNLPISIFLIRYYYRKFCIIHSGVCGEKEAQHFIKSLPKGYKVISNLKVSFKGQFAEMDLVVIGENGVFIIETKNHNGTIKGCLDDKNWYQYKKGRRGGEYHQEFHNPTKQVATHSYALSHVLKNEGISVWVQGIVYFSNSKAKVQVKTDTTHPVFAASYRGKQQLIQYICTYQKEKKFGKRMAEKVFEYLINQ